MMKNVTNKSGDLGGLIKSAVRIVNQKTLSSAEKMMPKFFDNDMNVIVVTNALMT